MSIIAEEKLQALVDRFTLLGEQLVQGGIDAQTYAGLSREYARLEPVACKIRELEDLRAEQKSLKQILSDGEMDPEMKSLASEEWPKVANSIQAVGQELKILLLPRDAADDRGIILELRAGTGGEEAALFVGELFRMYSRYAEIQGWKVEVVSASETGLGGYKDVVASIDGQGVYGHLKYESGVHRVQRVPVTDTGGRIHTSAATVAILPEAETVDVELLEKDLRVDVYRASGAGGQHVNKTDSAVRITHIPTGIVAAVQDSRSQHKNRAQALRLLRTKLYDLERTRVEQTRALDRREQVGSGDRSQRVRTYNFPQSRVTDHRIHLTVHKLEQILAGEGLAEVIEALSAADRADRLSAAGD